MPGLTRTLVPGEVITLTTADGTRIEMRAVVDYFRGRKRTKLNILAPDSVRILREMQHQAEGPEGGGR